MGVIDGRFMVRWWGGGLIFRRFRKFCFYHGEGERFCEDLGWW